MNDGAEKFAVLVVDDDPLVLGTISAMLAAEFQVFAATNAEEAKVTLRQQGVDIIVSDLKMPGGSGLELLDWARVHAPKSVRILMSGYAELEDVLNAINRCQVFRYLLKPWQPEELRQAVRDAARVAALERSHEQLLQQNYQLICDLEKRVRERTEELERANRLLETANRQLQQTNAMLEKLALTDELTGLPNRRAVEQLLQAELRRRSRYPSPLAVGMLDVDHFRNINSRYLHTGGDQVLIALARTLTNCIRGTDTVGRWGGEEFLIIAPITEPEGALVLAERIRTTLQDTPVHYDGHDIHFTVSLGFVAVPHDAIISSETLVYHAAAALQQAKARGRNCSVVVPVTESNEALLIASAS
ncbi:MAG: diguanylate cyclase [Gemmatales bacterium]|nr:diguanylate cyclase [Gemmatales bacterium]MDW8176242.1 diguanylate cyclase [Gemmatales bacterium]